MSGRRATVGAGSETRREIVEGSSSDASASTACIALDGLHHPAIIVGDRQRKPLRKAPRPAVRALLCGLDHGDVEIDGDLEANAQQMESLQRSRRVLSAQCYQAAATSPAEVLSPTLSDDVSPAAVTVSSSLSGSARSGRRPTRILKWKPPARRPSAILACAG